MGTNLSYSNNTELGQLPDYARYVRRRQHSRMPYVAPTFCRRPTEATQATSPGRNAPPQMTIEYLGTQVIEGVLVEGTRMSRTVPPRDGRPSTFTLETWDSVELKVNMLTKSSNGYTSKLVNLRRADPDPALFRPPTDYTVVDQ